MALLGVCEIAKAESPQADEEIACNQVIGIVSVQEIQTIAGAWVDFLLSSDDYTEEERMAAVQAFVGEEAKYDLQASRVCGSCKDYLSVLRWLDPFGFSQWREYCGRNAYGFEAQHSALVFQPIDRETGVPLSGVRNVAMAFQGTRLSVDRAFSVDFPKNVMERIVSEDPLGFVTTFADVHNLLVASSAGLIGIGPDYIGTGASADFDRSYLTAMPVQQAAVVSYLATQEYIEHTSQGCGQVGEDIMTVGYSAGGSAVVFGSIALERIGLNVVQQFSQAGVYSLPAISQSLIGNALAGKDIGVAEVGFWAFAAAAYSNDAPFLENSSTGQTLLSPDWINPANDTSKDVLGWIFDEKVNATELRARYPKTASEFLQSVNPDLFAPIIQAAQSGGFFCYPPFVTPEIEHLCEASIGNSPVSAWNQVHHPVQYCHSPDDEVVPRIMTDAFLVGALTGAGGTALQYRPVLDALRPRGGHLQGQLFCNAAVPTFLSHDDSAVSLLEVIPIDTGYNGKDRVEQLVCPPSA